MRNWLLKAVQVAIAAAVVIGIVETNDQPHLGAALILGIGVAFAITVVPVGVYEIIKGEIRKRRAIRARQRDPIHPLEEDEQFDPVSLKQKGSQRLSARHGRKELP